MIDLFRIFSAYISMLLSYFSIIYINLHYGMPAVSVIPAIKIINHYKKPIYHHPVEQAYSWESSNKNVSKNAWQQTVRDRLHRCLQRLY